MISVVISATTLKNPTAAKVNVKVNTLSVDSNHAERDKHIRSADFFKYG